MKTEKHLLYLHGIRCSVCELWGWLLNIHKPFCICHWSCFYNIQSGEIFHTGPVLQNKSMTLLGHPCTGRVYIRVTLTVKCLYYIGEWPQHKLWMYHTGSQRGGIKPCTNLLHKEPWKRDIKHNLYFRQCFQKHAVLITNAKGVLLCYWWDVDAWSPNSWWGVTSPHWGFTSSVYSIRRQTFKSLPRHLASAVFTWRSYDAFPGTHAQVACGMLEVAAI